MYKISHKELQVYANQVYLNAPKICNLIDYNSPRYNSVIILKLKLRRFKLPCNPCTLY